MRTLVACLLLSVSTFAQPTDFGKRNGYTWKAFYDNAVQKYSLVNWINKEDWIAADVSANKIWYVLGVYDLAVSLPVDNYTQIPGLYDTFYIPTGHPFSHVFGVSPDQMIKSLDKFYSDYRNLNVLILDAMQIANMEVTGKSEREIEWQTRYYRADQETKAEMYKERYYYDEKKMKVIDKVKDQL